MVEDLAGFIGIWLPTILLVAVGALLAWREPRRLLPGLLFTLATFQILIGVFGGALYFGQWLYPEVGGVSVVLGFLLFSVLGAVLLGVFLIWNTFEMFSKEGRGLAALVTAVVGAGILGFIALSVLSVVTGLAIVATWLLLLALPLAYLSFVFMSFLGYSLAYGAVTRRLRKPVDAVIILGSGLSGGERITPLLAKRIELGRKIYQRSRGQGRETVLIPSGGRGPDERLAEAEAMAAHLVDAGVPAEHILVEDRSTTTRENLTFSAATMERENITGRVAVATSNFHAFRAATLMRAVGLPGYSVGAPTAGYYWPSATVREFLAILRDHIRVNLVFVALSGLPVIIFTVVWLAHLFS